MILQKLHTQLSNVVEYRFIGTYSQDIAFNELIGKQIELIWNGDIFCRSCSKKTKKSFGEGFCYTCFMNAPEASPCIIRPELCEAHLGKGRDVEYEERNHNQPHIVYLTANDVVKVGITRTTQIPTRWIDQGASEAIILAEVPNRYSAGMIEVALKNHFSDKTNWRKMLTNQKDNNINLKDEKWRVHQFIDEHLSKFWSNNDNVIQIKYPIDVFPSSINSISFDKSPTIKGILTGLRGQYLYLDHNTVFNVRKHTGYFIQFNIND